MYVRMTTQIGGHRNLEPWPAPGGIVNVPDLEGADLITAGYAEPLTQEETDAIDQGDNAAFIVGDTPTDENSDPGSAELEADVVAELDKIAGLDKKGLTAKAAELGLEVPSKATVAALRDAVTAAVLETSSSSSSDGEDTSSTDAAAAAGDASSSEA